MFNVQRINSMSADALAPNVANWLAIDFVWDLNDECIDGLVQERRNSSALAIGLHLSCTNPSI